MFPFHAFTAAARHPLVSTGAVAGVAIFIAWLAPTSEPVLQQRDKIELPSVILNLIDDVEVPSREQGVIAEVLVQPNEAVVAGQPLARIDDQDRKIDLQRNRLELEIATANATSDIQLRRANEELAVAKVALERGEASRTRFSAAVSDADFDQLKLAVTEAKLLVEASELEHQNAQLKMQLAQNQVRQAEAALDRYQITSPLDSVVASVSRSPGEWVQPGDVVVRLIGLSRLRAEGFVDARLISRQSIGAAVTLFCPRDDGTEQPFTGRVSFVSDEVDPVNQQVRIWAEIENSDLGLRPGDRGRLVIETGIKR